MTYIPHELCGAHIDPAITDLVCQTLYDQGMTADFGDAFPDLKGYGAGKSVFLFDAETELFGSPLPSWVQTRGTCVEQGSGRAMQASIHNAVVYGDQIGSPLQVASELVYGMARINVPKSLGRSPMGRARPWGSTGRNMGDGASPDYAALGWHNMGLLPRGVYGEFDLSKPREDLAILWGNAGVPQALLDLAKAYPAQACYRITSVDSARDAIAARYGLFRAADRATGTNRDADGMTGIVPSGGHCEYLNAVWVDPRGDLCFGEQQSWPGTAAPHGDGTFKTLAGREVKPPEGCGGIRPDAIEYYIRNGSIWAVAAPFNLPRPATMRPSEAAA